MTIKEAGTGIRPIIPGPIGPLAPNAIIRQQRSYPGYGPTLPRIGKSDREQVGFVQFTLNGCGRVHSMAGDQRIPVGSCLLCTLDNELHYAAAPEGWEFVFMSFAGRSARAFIEDLVSMHGFVLRCDIGHGVVRRLLEYTDVDTVQSRQLDAGLAARIAGDVLLQLTEWNAPQTQQSDRLLHDAMALLSRDLADPPAIAAVAQACGVSREYLSRQFTAQLGCPPARWLQNERLRHAAVLLRFGQDPIDAIASAVGFNSASALGAAFKTQYGCTPGTYRAGTG